ncbi:hypothetical protein [Kribbella flavida]|nr:hypothetical protein [Kribbella flavida]
MISARAPPRSNSSPAKVPSTDDPKAIETTVDHDMTPAGSGTGISHPPAG